MSRERELLKRVISGDDAGDFFIGYSLYKDIETFLDQPEPEPEQEPEAWILEDKKTGYRRQCAYKPTVLFKEAYKVIPLYTAPPKREPLINIYVLNAFKADDEATHPYSYWAGVEFAEKHHGIGVDDE